MANCYNCDAELTEANKSVEHIIPNALGGVWKSKELLCEKCNKEFGNTVDTSLCTSLHSIAALLNIDRERGEHPPIRNARSESGELYHLVDGRHPVKTKPVVELDNEANSFYISARDDKELKRIIKQLKKKYPRLDDNNIESKVTRTREYLNESLHINMTLGGEDFHRSILKIAVTAWMERFKDKAVIAPALEVLKNSSIDPLEVVMHYYTTELMLPPTSKEVTHTVYIKGDQSKEKLFAYVELFSSCGFIVMLNKEYKGENLEFLYCYDVLNATQTDRVPNINYNGEFSTSLSKESISILEKKLARVVYIADKRQEELQINSITTQAIDKVLSKYPDATHFTKEILEELAKELAENAAPFIAHVHTKKERLRNSN